MNSYLTKNGIKILKNEPLSRYTFTKTGGNADYLAFPKDVEQVKKLMCFASERHYPVTVLGRASNLIIRDGGIRGLTMILTKMNKIKVRHHLIMADAGAPIIDVSVCAQKHSLSGLAFAAGIPGSVGGAIFMNAGAYGGSTSQAVQSVVVLTPDHRVKRLTNQQLDFSYRHSLLQDQANWIVLSAKFKLSPGEPEIIRDQMDDFNAQRSSKQPLDFPSCGSVFKRPVGHYAGQLIHDAHLQGYQSGGARVSRVHAGFIVNVGHATATDYLNVIHHVQHQVYMDSGVHLHLEVRIIGQKMDN